MRLSVRWLGLLYLFAAGVPLLVLLTVVQDTEAQSEGTPLAQEREFTSSQAHDLMLGKGTWRLSATWTEPDKPWSDGVSRVGTYPCILGYEADESFWDRKDTHLDIVVPIESGFPVWCGVQFSENFDKGSRGIHLDVSPRDDGATRWKMGDGYGEGVLAITLSPTSSTPAPTPVMPTPASTPILTATPISPPTMPVSTPVPTVTTVSPTPASSPTLEPTAVPTPTRTAPPDPPPSTGDCDGRNPVFARIDPEKDDYCILTFLLKEERIVLVSLVGGAISVISVFIWLVGVSRSQT